MDKLNLGLSIALGLSTALGLHCHLNNTEIASIEKVVYVDRNITIPPKTYITPSAIKSYIASYSHLSNRQVVNIYQNILKASNTYNIPASVLVAIIAQESSFKAHIRHSKVKVSIRDSKDTAKKAYVTAIGMAAIIWEIWGKELIKSKVVEKRYDLYDTEIAIKATAHILAYNRDTYKPLKGLSKLESAIQRYYGVIYKENKLNDNYLKSVNHKLGDMVIDIYK